jgi:hypothetical protein
MDWSATVTPLADDVERVGDRSCGACAAPPIAEGPRRSSSFCARLCGEWVEARSMVESMLAGPWLLRGHQEALLPAA